MGNKSATREISADEDILVFGYIRTNNNAFPTEIMKICHAYWGFFEFDTWHKEFIIDQYCSLNSDQTIATSSCAMPICVYGTKPVKCGIFKWKLRLNETGHGQLPLIGIIKNDITYLSRHQYQNIEWYLGKGGYLLVGDTGHTVSADRRIVENYAKKLKKGDIIEICLNLIARTLRFYINGKDHGIAFRNIHEYEYRLCVGKMAQSSCEIEILQHY